MKFAVPTLLLLIGLTGCTTADLTGHPSTYETDAALASIVNRYRAQNPTLEYWNSGIVHVIGEIKSTGEQEQMIAELKAVPDVWGVMDLTRVRKKTSAEDRARDEEISKQLMTSLRAIDPRLKVFTIDGKPTVYGKIRASAKPSLDSQIEVIRKQSRDYALVQALVEEDDGASSVTQSAQIARAESASYSTSTSTSSTSTSTRHEEEEEESDADYEEPESESQSQLFGAVLQGVGQALMSGGTADSISAGYVMAGTGAIVAGNSPDYAGLTAQAKQASIRAKQQSETPKPVTIPTSTSTSTSYSDAAPSIVATKQSQELLSDIPGNKVAGDGGGAMFDSNANPCIQYSDKHPRMPGGYGYVKNGCAYKISVLACTQTAKIDGCALKQWQRFDLEAGRDNFTAPHSRVSLVACRSPYYAVGSKAKWDGNRLTAFCQKN